MLAVLLTIVSLVGAVQGLVLAVALASTRGPGRAAQRILAALLSSGSVAVAMIALSHRPELGDPRPFELVEAGLTLLMAPFSLLYARLVTDGTVAPRRYAWHFAPALAWGTWAAVGVALHGAHGVWLPPIGGLVVYQALYTGVAGATLWQRWGPRRPAGVHRFWSRAWIALLLALHAAQAVRFSFPRMEAVRDVVPLTLSGGFLALTFAGFRHSSLFGARGGTGGRRAPRDPRLRQVSDRVRALLERDRRYLDPDLSLATVAAELGLPRSLVSRAVNLGDDQGFLDLVTGYRIDEARRLLADGSKDHLTIEAIAQRSGFASRSAFYDAFGRSTGATPGEFRQQARQASVS